MQILILEKPWDKQIVYLGFHAGKKTEVKRPPSRHKVKEDWLQEWLVAASLIA